MWSELARIEDHVEWMMDATAIRFLSASRSGVGHKVRVRHQGRSDPADGRHGDHGVGRLGSHRSATRRCRQRVGPFHPDRRPRVAPRASHGRSSSAFRGGWGQRWGRAWPSPCSLRCGREICAVWAVGSPLTPTAPRRERCAREDRRHGIPWAHRILVGSLSPLQRPRGHPDRPGDGQGRRGLVGPRAGHHRPRQAAGHGWRRPSGRGRGR